MIEEIKGNLFDFIKEGDVIVHGCNCFHTMGAGFAKTVKYMYPEAYKADLLSKYGDKSKMGSFTFADIEQDRNPFRAEAGMRNFTVVNLYTQHKYGTDIPHFSYMSFHLALEEVKSTFPNRRIIMPKIGTGLAGGNWNVIKMIIETVFPLPGDNVVIYSL